MNYIITTLALAALTSSLQAKEVDPPALGLNRGGDASSVSNTHSNAVSHSVSHGGNAVAHGGDSRATVSGSGNSDNRNTNTQSQVANGGRASSDQSQSQSVKDSGNSSVKNTLSNDVTTSNSLKNSGNSTSNSGGNTLSNAGNNAAQSVSVDARDQSTVIHEAQARNPVSSAVAPSLAASNGTCMGSTSGGAQSINLGLSFGTTWTDVSCDMRYDAQALASVGMRGAAVARLCQKQEIADAMAAAGTPCPVTPKEKAKTEASAKNEPTDPYVRMRLGLPSLEK